MQSAGEVRVYAMQMNINENLKQSYNLTINCIYFY